MKPSRLALSALGSAGLAAVGVYGGQAAQFRRHAGTRLEFVEKHFDQDFDDAEEILASRWGTRSAVDRAYDLVGGALRHSL